MWGGAQGDVDANTALQWLWRTYAPQRLASWPLLPSPLTFIDVETTRDRVVELALVRFATGNAPIVYHTYIDPGAQGWSRSQSYWNTDIHGLTPRLVHGRPPFHALIPGLHQLTGDATVVAHNISFERRFLHAECARMGGGWARPELCTLKLARLLYPDRKAEGSGYKLDALASALDIRNPAPHRAIGDTMSTVWVLLGMLEANRGHPALAAHVREALREAGGRPRSPWVS